MKKIIIDCDPGHDDMMAIILAYASDAVELLGITTVAGNQTGEKTFLNALKVLTLLKAENLPVARGFDRPLTRELTVAPEIHGVSGLDGANLPEPVISGIGEHAVDFIIRTLMQAAEPIILIPTGPLTNIGVALLKEPRIKINIERIVLMGGAVYDSNITPAAEFNIYVDPEAATIVFESGLPITMVGLDVTNKAMLTFKDISEIEKFAGPVSSVVAPLLRFFAQANSDIFNFQGAPLHDALAVAEVIRPGIVKTTHLHVAVETAGRFTRGRTVADVHGITNLEPNVDVALEVDVPLFKEMMIGAIRELDKR
jgi:inosine-uridine nucleoside N-ribohydrolase